MLVCGYATYRIHVIIMMTVRGVGRHVARRLARRGKASEPRSSRDPRRESSWGESPRVEPSSGAFLHSGGASPLKHRTMVGRRLAQARSSWGCCSFVCNSGFWTSDTGAYEQQTPVTRAFALQSSRAATALHPLIWCFSNQHSQGSSDLKVCFCHRHP